VKTFNTLLAGSAAGLLSVVAAQAADLPSRKSAPVEYVRVCDAYGAGFYWIPGTDTCLKVGGRVRIDTWYTPAKNAVALRSAGGPAYAGIAAPAGTNIAPFQSSNGIDQLGWYARGIVNMDARTQSAWGTVQTVFSLRLAAQTGLAQTAPNGNLTAVPAAGQNGATIEAAYIRFAGFTIGQAASNFTFLPPYQYHSNFSTGFPNGIRQLSYTATFGGGFSATIALENRGDLGNSATANSLGANPFTVAGATATAVGPQRLPALVGNVRVDQGWGSAMLSGAVLQNTVNFATPAVQAVTNGLGPLVTKTGWAIAAGLRINLPMIAAGDHIQGWIGYGNGAMDYVGYSGVNQNSAVTTNYLGGFLRNDRNVTIFCTTAAATCIPGSETTKSFNVAGMFTHYWTPSLRQNFIGSYIRITPGQVTQNTDWTNGGLSQVTAWDVKSNLIWSPVRNFDIGLELSYARLSQRLTGLAGGLPTPLACTAANPQCLASTSTNNWTGRMRVERTF